MDIDTLRRDFINDKEFNQSAINEYNQALAYYHGNQLPPDVLNILQAREQTPIVENIYKMIVNKILGYKISSLQEVRLTPRQEEDKALSDILNDILRYISQHKNFDKEIIRRDKHLIMGLSVLEVWITQDAQSKDIEIQAIDPQSFIIDSYSVDSNAQDARRFHKILNISEEVAKNILGDVEIIYTQSGTKERRAEVIESWYKEFNTASLTYEWNRYIWNPTGGIYKDEQKPFKNNTHPFIIAKFYTDEKGKWYGLFRDIKPMQDYINYAENRMANMMGSFKAMFEEDAVVDIDQFIEEMTLDNAIVKVRSGSLNNNKIHFMQHHSDIQALSQKAEQKRNLTKIIAGLNDESLGVAHNRQSGVAIAQRRESGLMGLQDFLKISDEMDKLLYEKIISFITHYFDKKQVFSIVDKKVGQRFFSINDKAENMIRPSKFDLIYKTQLKTESKDERFAHWNELLKIINITQPNIIPELLPLMLKDIDSPLVSDLQEILAEAKVAQQAQAEANAPLLQEQQALELQMLKARIAELEAKAHKYTQQGDLAESHTQSEGINQAISVETLDNIVENNQPPQKTKATDAGTKWQKYPSAHHLEK